MAEVSAKRETVGFGSSRSNGIVVLQREIVGFGKATASANRVYIVLAALPKRGALFRFAECGANFDQTFLRSHCTA